MTGEAIRERVSALIDEFERIAATLGETLILEEARTKSFDPNHFTYSAVARSLRTRRDNLLHSAKTLRAQFGFVEPRELLLANPYTTSTDATSEVA